MSNFVINPNKRDGYPSIDDNVYDFGPSQTSPFPANIMYEDGVLLDGYPRMINWKDLSPAQNKPYPANIMSCNETLTDGYPSFYTYGEFSPTMGEPHQREVMSCKDGFLDGYPTYRVAKNFRDFGAFTNSSIEEVEIPRSVMYICDYAFYDTLITSVKINKNCIYYAHSFPLGCNIKLYED